MSSAARPGFDLLADEILLRHEPRKRRCIQCTSGRMDRGELKGVVDSSYFAINNVENELEVDLEPGLSQTADGKADLG